MIESRTPRRRFLFVLLFLSLSIGLSLTAAPALHSRSRLQVSPPDFSKAFAPATVGPGSSTTLTFTIDNATDSPVGDLAFSDTLPAGLIIATPSNAATTCTNGAVGAPDGGTTITFSGGRLGASSTCTVSVNITASTTPGTYTNVSGDLTSDAGNSGTATADLTVDGARPGFSKSFAPGTIYPEETSTLTFTLDNSASGTSYFSLSFSDPLPEGVVVAAPANAASDCSASITADPGSTTISVFTNLAAGSVCTITVDVTATSVGDKNNVSSELTGSNLATSGFATDLLVVEPRPAFYKTFTNDPVPPGMTATLEFSITNMDRRSSATGITFTDDLDAALTGLTATGLPAVDVCGSGSQLEGTSTLTFSGGSLGPGETCTFTTTVQVPAAAATGSYTNTTSALTSDAGDMEPPATDDLKVAPIPTLLSSFVPNPVGAGETVDMEFTLVNNSSTNPATDINFTQVLGEVLSGVSAQSLPPADFCGTGSSMAQTLDPLTLYMTGGNLPAGGDCTFTVTLQLSPSMPNGTYALTSSHPNATVDGETLAGHPARAELTVIAPPNLSKSFTDDPVVAGDDVTLEFTLTHSENAPGTATGVSFTDNLDAALTGLTAVGLPADDVCGTGSRLEGTSTLTFTGGVVAPASSCTFTVTLQTPAGAEPDLYTNTTSEISATVDGYSVTGPAVSADLEIGALSLAKAFSEGSVVPGDTLSLTFTLNNESAASTATDINFTDDLDAALTGLTAVELPPGDVCGAGSSLSGTSTLTFTGGVLSPGSSCTFSATLQVPAGSPSLEVQNVTSEVTANLGGTLLTADPAADDLIVLEALSLGKSFVPDAAAPGDAVTLTFTITNNSAANTITGISFTDDLDAALSGLTAVELPAGDVCGAGSSLSGTSLLTMSGGSLGPGETCTFAAGLELPTDVSAGETAINTTSVITGSLGGETVTGAAATDELDAVFFAFAKSFDGPTVAGGNPTLSFTIENLTGEEQLGLSFVDDLDAVLAGLSALALPPGDVCGPGSTLTGTSLLTLSGGSLGAGQSCVISITLQVPTTATPGTYTNTTSELTQQGLPVGKPAADTLEVEPPPAFAKQFAPNPILLGATSTLSLAIDNGASAVDATDLAFVDNLPAGLNVATPANASTTCSGGTLSAPDGGTTIAYSGGTVAAAASCTVQVDVVGIEAGAHSNTTGTLTSSSGSSGTASDTLTVNPPPAFNKRFAPQAVPVGATSTLSFTIDNSTSTVDATDLAFVDNLPAGLSVATPANASTTCSNGTLSAPDGATAISYSGGTVAAGATCTLAVDVTSDTGGVYDNVSGALSSSLGTSGSAADTLVVGFPAIHVAVTALPASVPEPGGDVEITVVVTNVIPAGPLTLTSLVDDVYGDLDGQGNCELPATVGSGESYTCSFSASVSGNAGDAVTNTVTATATGADDDEATDQDSATVTIGDVLPGASVHLAVTPTVIYAPGDQVTFTVRVTNTSAAEAITLATLTDDVVGDLNGVGDCTVPMTIAIGSTYQCRYAAQVTGQPGDSLVNVVTAVVHDDDGNQLSPQAASAIDVHLINYYPIMFIGGSP